MTEGGDLVVVMEAIFETLNRMASEQRKFHAEAIRLPGSLEAEVQSMAMDTNLQDAARVIESDVSIIADRYRPTNDEF